MWPLNSPVPDGICFDRNIFRIPASNWQHWQFRCKFACAVLLNNLFKHSLSLQFEPQSQHNSFPFLANLLKSRTTKLEISLANVSADSSGCGMANGEPSSLEIRRAMANEQIGIAIAKPSSTPLPPDRLKKIIIVKCMFA